MAKRLNRPSLDSLGPESCILYLRISQDRDGEQLAVERQERECRELAARLGLQVERVLIDNDISATSGKVRPAFEEVLTSRPQAVVAWHQDRLLRLTSDLERVIDLGVPVYTVVAGTLDLATPAGRAVARTVAAWSQYEGEQKAERQRASNRQRAEKGYWQFSNRPYGYERVDGEIRIVEEEAAVIRELYERIIAGESYYALAADLNRRGILTVTGVSWKLWRVQRLLENSHNAGIVSHLGEEYPGVEPTWEPIIDRRTWADFVELKTNRKTKRSWATTPRHLLSGTLICGKCEGSMFSHAQLAKHPDENGVRKKTFHYTCHECFGCSVRAVPVEELIEEVVLARLSDKKVIRALRTTPDTAPVQEEIAKLTTARGDVTALLADGVLSRREARDKLMTLGDRLEAEQSRLTAMRRESPLTDLALGRSIPSRWRKLSVLEKRRVISELGLVLRVGPGKRGPRPRTTDGSVQTVQQAARARVEVDWVV